LAAIALTLGSVVKPYRSPSLSRTKTQFPSMVAGTRRVLLVCKIGAPLSKAPVDASSAQRSPPPPPTEPASTTPPALTAGTDRGIAWLFESNPNAVCEAKDGEPQPLGLLAVVALSACGGGGAPIDETYVDMMRRSGISYEGLLPTSQWVLRAQDVHNHTIGGA
jgi:hypothetical protein